jgi:PAS domain S-box-containing protein
VDAEERYQFCNRAYEDWFGHDRESVRGLRVQEVLGDLAYQAIQDNIEAALSGESIQYEVDVPYRSGGTRHVDAAYIPDVADDGTVRGFVALVTDVTARVQGARRA